MGSTVARSFQAVKNFLFRFVNRKFLVFLFFLVISGVFWLITTLNETMEKEVTIPVILTNVPKNMVIMSDGNDTVRITVRDKGYTLATYFYTDHIKPIVISLPSYIKSDEHANVSQAELQKMVLQRIYGSSQVISIKPDRLEYYFVNHNSQKSVPVRFAGNVHAERNHTITAINITPKNVTVYAPQKILDSLQSIPIGLFNMSSITDTVRKDIKLQRMKGVKTVPDQVRIEICADRLTEKTVEVPVETINVPDGKKLRIFPSRINIKCTVGASQFKNITEDDFKIVADYNSLTGAVGEKCVIRLVAVSEKVSNARLEVSEVDYLIEQ